jgi:hypothetical protein
MAREMPSPRLQLIRDVAVLQIKLVVDGFRDALLIPFSLLAGLLGVLRGGEDADREFRHVLNLGRRSEHWINLFGRKTPFWRSGTAGSLDRLLDRVEATVMEQYRKGKNTDEARAAINAALEETETEKAGRESA